MKKRYLLILAFVSGCISFTPNASAQALEQGNFTVDAYYGFPNMMTSLFRVIAEGSTDDPNLKVSGFGPVGARAQYMVSDNIGVGLEFYYANSSFTYVENTIDSLGNNVTYNYKLSNPRPRIVLRADFHFGESDMVDPYFAVGLGYSGSKYVFTTDDPYFDESTYDTRNLLPVAYRLAFGTKVYFLEFLGVGAEVAIGGPLITFGISGKF